MGEVVVAKILDGNVFKKARLEALTQEVDSLFAQTGRKPGLAVILVGEDPASHVYVGMKKKACESLGLVSTEHKVPADFGEDALADLIQTLNDDATVDGILLQMPLPKGYDEDRLLGLISPDKDVDGFHPENVGKLLIGKAGFKSCTPYGVCELLDFYDIPTEGKHVVIIGRSNIVGKPLAAMLMQNASPGNATVTVCHSRTQNLSELTKQADILIAAIGKPEFVTADMVKPGAVVIDVGINRVDDATSDRGYKLVGDVAYDAVAERSSAITPVPGGVGPLTIAMLMSNTVQSFKAKL